MLEQLVHFSNRLRAEGLAVNSSNLIDLCHCIHHIDIVNEDDFYAASRATLVSSHKDLALFERVYGEFWHHEKQQQLTPNADQSEFAFSEAGDEDTVEEHTYYQHAKKELSDSSAISERTSYSPYELLMQKDLGTMTDAELEQACRLIAELITIIANYNSRRRIMDKRGREMDFRKMLRRNATYGLDGMEIMFRKKRIKKTRLMLLCDVSGSMENYCRFLIQFIYGIYQKLDKLEVAVFSTRMTHISELLKTHNVNESLQKVSRAVHDWSGGTNIGGCIREFNHRFAHEMSSSRTIVIIVSDGWDRGDARVMREEMEHLRQHVYKILWMNPLLGKADYQPLCRGIQTAMPYIDFFMPAHNLESFAKLIQQLRAIWR